MADAPEKVVDYFLGQSTTLCLTIEQAEILEATVDYGVGLLEVLFRTNQYRLEHIREVLRYALIGGGASASEADEKVKLALKSGSVLKHVDLCHRIIIAFLGPLEDDDGKKPEALAEAGDA